MAKEKKDNKKKIETFFVILLFICLLSMLFRLLTQKKVSGNSQDFVEPIKISKNAEITDNEGNMKIVDLPYTINTNKPFTLSFDMSQVGDLSNKTLSINQLYMDSVVSVSGTEISKFNVTKKSLAQTGNIYAFLLLDIPYDVHGDKVSIKYSPVLKSNEDYMIDPMYLGSRSSFLVSCLLKKDGMELLFTLIIFILSITSLFWTRFTEKNNIQINSFMKVGLISFSAAVFTITKFDIIIYLFYEYRQLLYYFQFISLMFITYFMINMAQSTLDPKYDKLLLLAKQITFVNFIIQNILALTYTVEFEKMVIFTYVTMFAHLSILFYVLIKTNAQEYKGKKDLLRTIVPCMTVFVFGFLTYFIQKYWFASMLSYANIAVYLGGNGYFLIVNYMNTRSKNADTVEYKKMMKIDELTGVYNRYAFETRTRDIEKNAESVHITLIDIDNLKPINDNLGHYYGDNVIIRVANYIEQCMPHSSIYRVGGDEFVAITEVDYVEEAKKMDKVVLFVDGVSEKYDVTFSIGKAFYDPSKEESIEEVIKMSDELMYSNKKKYKSGLRNRYSGDGI